MPIKFSHVSFIYNPHSPLEFQALKDISLEIPEGSFSAIVGRTGCGKSTLIQHINALLHPSEGEVEVEGFLNASDKKRRSKNAKDLRHKVGLVFQFPEYQLFEETVLKDVAYGPKNFGASKEEAEASAKEALKLVGLDASFYERSPFDLSGGEKRRVAIAGILAYHPRYLIVDEPTAGLDPQGAEEMMKVFAEAHAAGTTVVLVTHDMNLVLRYCDSVYLFSDGRLVKQTTPQALFAEDMEEYAIETPMLYRFEQELSAKGHPEVLGLQNIEELAAALAKGRQKR